MTQKLELTESYLQQRYVADRLTQKQIAHESGHSIMVVNRAMKDLGIVARSRTQVQGKTDQRLEDPKALTEMLKHNSATEVAAILGVHKVSLYNRLSRYNIDTRALTPKPIKLPKPEPKRREPSEASLRRLYELEFRSIDEIAAVLKLSHPTVSKYMRKYNIARRSGSQANLKDPAKLLALEDSETLKKGYQELGSVNLAKSLGVSRQTVIDYMYKHGLTVAPSSATTSGEHEIGEYLISLGLEVQKHVVGAIDGRKELDLLIPSHSLAVEFNGVFWHSSRFKSRSYHYDKYKACESAGIRLIQVWEDDWRDRRPIVESMLAHKLGLSSDKIYARKTTVVQVPHSQAQHFYDTTHIQGGVSAKFHYGLMFGSELVAVCSFKTDTTRIADWDLVRFSSSRHVIGGFSRLLKHFRQSHAGSIKTFADLQVSDGALYERCGFTFDNLIGPDYKYVVKNTRVHKFQYRLPRFKNDPNLSYEEGMTESELADLNGLLKVYDAGKLRYILK